MRFSIVHKEPRRDRIWVPSVVKLWQLATPFVTRGIDIQHPEYKKRSPLTEHVIDESVAWVGGLLVALGYLVMLAAAGWVLLELAMLIDFTREALPTSY